MLHPSATHSIPDISAVAVIMTFHANVWDVKMREKLSTRWVRTIAELIQLADKCAQAEEGRRVPREADPGDDGEARKGRNHKWKPKAVLRVESIGKKYKVEDKGKEMAAMNHGSKSYCKIQWTANHDLRDCQRVKYLIEKQKQEYEKRDKGKKKAQDGAGGFKKDHGGREGHGGGDKNKERPARGRDKKEGNDGDDEDGNKEEEHGFQEAYDVACIHRGASSLSCHQEFKQLSREVNDTSPMYI